MSSIYRIKKGPIKKIGPIFTLNYMKLKNI